MKNRELIEKLQKLDPEMEVGIADSEWGFDLVAEVSVELQNVPEIDILSPRVNPLVPNYKMSDKPREVVVLSA